jgi:hypothetical protein
MAKMTVMSIRCFIVALFLFVPSGWGATGTSAPATRPVSPAKLEGTTVTEHSVVVDGHALKYRATAGTLTLRDGHHKPSADFFFVAYDREGGPGDVKNRPIVFLFNGGPGAASVWLHLGTVGPKRVELGPIGQPPAPPYRLADNRETWLDAADLVFIDPAHLCWALENLVEGKVVNEIRVDPQTRKWALVALERMLAIKGDGNPTGKQQPAGTTVD